MANISLNVGATSVNASLMTPTNIKDGSVTTDKLADGAVTTEKLNEAVRGQISDLKSDITELNNAVFTVSDNLFDYTQSKVNQLPNSWSGQTYNDFSTLNGWKTSNLIEVEAGTEYCVIENGILKKSYRVDFYDSNGSYITQVDMGLNTTVTAPENAKYMYMFKSGTNPDFSSSNLAIKVYSESMDYVLRPYGNIERYLTSPYTYGLYKSGDDYYHFTKVADSQYLVRQFARFGINNLIDLKGMYYGDVHSDTLSIGTAIGTTTTDTIGPISIHRGSVDGYAGSWSGGVHGISVGGVEYPTAEQTDLKVYCNGKEITEDGLYWGKVTLVATNDLYFPKTITGADLSTATKAIKEVRRYELTEVMDVKVSLSFYTTTYIVQYYGCQCLSFDMTTLRFPNNETVQNTARQSNYVGTVKENTLIGDHDTTHYEVSVKPLGLGTFIKNNGTAADVGYCYLATFSKFYFVMIANEAGITRRGYPENTFYWEATYNYYVD